MSLVFQFAKSLLSQKLRERFQTHSTFQKLSETFPSHILPNSYFGGGQQSQSEMIDLWLQEMESKREEVLGLDKMHYSLSAEASDKVKRKMSKDQSGHNHVEAGGATGVLEVVSSVRKMENGKDN